MIFIINSHPAKDGCIISKCRQRQIEENMHQMPQMIADYRKKVEELRKKTRAKKQRTEEQQYLIATGKAQETHSWEVFRDRTK